MNLGYYLLRRATLTETWLYQTNGKARRSHIFGGFSFIMFTLVWALD
jgi:hypothetical protein